MAKSGKRWRQLARAVSLSAFLFAYWLALSGHYTPFLMSVGAICTLACVLIAIRMGILDAEGHPVHLAFGALRYVPWLIFEIIKSALNVSRIILSPALPISPTMTSLKASQKTPVGVCIYGNSITLTPGTITVGVTGGDRLLVHALVREGADDLEAGAMDRRVARFEGA